MIYPPAPIAAYVLTLPQQKTDPLISLDFNDTPVRSALETLFKAGGIKNYILDKSISGTVTLKAKDLPFPKALSLVLAQNSQELIMTYQSIGENDVMVFRLKGTPEARPELQWRVFELRNRTAKALTVPFSSKLPAGIHSLLTAGDYTVMVQGEPKALGELMELLKELDTPVPSVECSIEVAVVTSTGKTSLLRTMESGLCGTEIKSEGKFTAAAQPLSRLNVTIRPRSMNNNEFELETSWDASISLPGEQKGQFIQIEKTFTTTRRVKAGATMTFGSVVIKEEQGGAKGGQEVLFFVTLKPL